MALNCGHSTIKYVLFIFNLLWSLCGLSLIVYGGLVKDPETETMRPSLALIVFGAIMFSISFFGCCGAIRESYCMTLTYSFFLVLLIIIQMVIAMVMLQDIPESPEVSNDEVAWVFIGIGIVELLGVISGCCLANAIRNSEDRWVV